MKPVFIKKLLAAFVLTLGLSNVCAAQSRNEPVNYFYETKSLLDITDPVGDDKGPGYYQYPLDKRMRRGTFDLKRFSVFEEGDVVVFEIQMRNYIMREWPDTGKSEDQGFVANMWDIYIDIDGRENSGYKMALPGRDLMFSGNMGWEKVIMATPLSEYELFDILRNKTDELEFQNRVEDIVYPDYIRVQRDKVILKIAKKKLPGISEKSGYQCLTMGFKKIVSPNRLLNRDVRSFSTQEDFGGGHDTFGDPPVMDIIVPEEVDQYQVLRDFRSEPFREDISYTSIPFVYAGGKKSSPQLSLPVVKEPVNNSTGLITAPPDIKPVTAPAVKAPVKTQPAGSGFVPLKPTVKKNPAVPAKKTDAPVNGFIPVKKKE